LGRLILIIVIMKPKSRMLLAIVSKMSKEGLLNNQQKGKTHVSNL